MSHFLFLMMVIIMTLVPLPDYWTCVSSILVIWEKQRFISSSSQRQITDKSLRTTCAEERASGATVWLPIELGKMNYEELAKPSKFHLKHVMFSCA